MEEHAAPTLTPSLGPRLAVVITLSISKDNPASVRSQWRKCLAEVSRLNGRFDATSDVFRETEDLEGLIWDDDGWPALLRRVEQERAYDGVVVASLPTPARDPRAWHDLKRILGDGSCDLHVVTAPLLTLFGPTSVMLDLWVSIARSEADATQLSTR